ncbi:MAG: YfhO family protein [Thermoanaerobaculia bacterium]
MSTAEAEPTRRVSARTTLLAGGALALLVLVAFTPVVLGARCFFHLDLFYEHLPVWDVTQKALLAGDSPFWIDGEYCGQPPLFHQEAPLFYPLTVPLLWTGAPVSRLADLFSLFHFWLAGFAAFLLLRDLTRSASAALFGGVAWMLSARMVQSALWPNAVAVSALLPLALLGVFWIARGQRRSGILVTAVVGGLALLAARPHVLLAATPILLSVSIAAILRAPRRLQAIGDFLLAAALAFALGAPSLVPSLALYPEMSRAAGLSRAERDIRPMALGQDLAPVFLPVDVAPRWPETAAYPGLFVALLFVAGIGLTIRGGAFPRGTFLALAIGGAVGLVFAVGENGPYGLIADLPLIRGFRVPARYLVSWSLALALGSALALAHLLARAQRPRLCVALALLGLSADLVWHARRAAPTAPAAVQTVEPDLVGVLRERLGTDAAGFPRRYLSQAETLNPLLFYDPDLLFAVQHHDPLKGAIGMRFGLESAYGAGPPLRRSGEMLSRPSPRALELAGVACVVSSAERPAGTTPELPPPMRVQAFPGLARAHLLPEGIVVPPEKAIAVVLSPALDPRRTAVLEEGEPVAADPGWKDEEASVRVVTYRPGRIALDARLPARGVLVLFNAYESGWQAAVDGAPFEVERADGAFQGIRLPAGRHRVELVYRPPGLREGLGVGLAGVLGVILLAIRLRTAESPRPVEPPTI